LDGVEVSSPILFSSAISKIFDYLDNPENKPIQSHDGVNVYFRVGNLFIFAFDTDEQRRAYQESYEKLTGSTQGYIPRIGNLFERNGKYYFVGDYSDTKLADISDTTKTNESLYRGVVINPVIFAEQMEVKQLTQANL
jgi:hypothetical protein